MTDTFKALLEQPVVSRVRRNHGLEHATINILSSRFPGVPMAGHSNPSGFVLIGDLPTEAVQAAIEEALQRMRAGERQLAIAPFCGTNLVTAGFFTGIAGFLAMWGVGPKLRDKLERIPFAIAFSTLALAFSMPLGLIVQERVTTSASPGALEVVEILRFQQRRAVAHRITTRG